MCYRKFLLWLPFILAFFLGLPEFKNKNKTRSHITFLFQFPGAKVLNFFGHISDFHVTLGGWRPKGRSHLFFVKLFRLEHTRSCLILEAKQGRAWLVLGWETKLGNPARQASLGCRNKRPCISRPGPSLHMVGMWPGLPCKRDLISMGLSWLNKGH